MLKHPDGDVLAYLDETYQLPTDLVTVRDGVATHTTQMTTVEMWMNPKTGVIEPFVVLRLDENGRLPIARTSLLTVEEKRVEPHSRYPDWGGQLGDLGLRLEAHSTAVWGVSGLVVIGLLGLILFLLRGR